MKKILLVEDEPIIRELMEMLLERFGVVIPAIGSTDGWEKFSEGNFDLVFSDFDLNDKLNGIEFLKKIVEVEITTGKSCRKVLYTARSRGELREYLGYLEWMEQNGVVLLPKPVDAMIIIQTTESLLKG